MTDPTAEKGETAVSHLCCSISRWKKRKRSRRRRASDERDQR
jgi:hypothetical protein